LANKIAIIAKKFNAKIINNQKKIDCILNFLLTIFISKKYLTQYI